MFRTQQTMKQTEMIPDQVPSFFRGGGQAERRQGFFLVTNAADMLESRQHFRGAFRQRRQRF